MNTAIDSDTFHDVKAWAVPSLDVHEQDGDLRLLVDLPGVTPDGLHLTADRGVLTLVAARADRSGRGYRRQLKLPDGVDPDTITAELRHGVLAVLLPQAAAHRSRTIPVTVQT